MGKARVAFEPVLVKNRNLVRPDRREMFQHPQACRLGHREDPKMVSLCEARVMAV
jgi:hypothetical protein